MSRTVVGVLRGGTSSEYDLSLRTGAEMIKSLPEDRYQVRDIFIDKQGTWHSRGIPVDPIRALTQVDVVLNALHGGLGEDGTVGRVFQRAGIPHAGSTPLASALSLNKIRAREIVARAGILVPQGVSFTLSTPHTTGEMARQVFQRFAPPYVVKPPSEGASHGIRIVAHIIDLPDAIGDVLDQYGAALVEEYIRGREATVGIIRGFRDQELYAFPPVHVVKPEGARHIEHMHHREGLICHEVPTNNFDFDQKERLMHLARAAHTTLDLGHFSRADFIVTPKYIYLLEVNAIPGLYKGAAFPQMLESVGSSVPEFVEHSINLARQRITA